MLRTNERKLAKDILQLLRTAEYFVAYARTNSYFSKEEKIIFDGITDKKSINYKVVSKILKYMLNYSSDEIIYPIVLSIEFDNKINGELFNKFISAWRKLSTNFNNYNINTDIYNYDISSMFFIRYTNLKRKRKFKFEITGKTIGNKTSCLLSNKYLIDNIMDNSIDAFDIQIFKPKFEVVLRLMEAAVEYKANLIYFVLDNKTISYILKK